MTRKHMLAFGLGGIALVALAAGASAFITKEVMDDKPAVVKTVEKPTAPKTEKVTWNEPRQEQQRQPAAKPACDDGNIVGYGLGGVAGGVAGNQIGSGNGKTAATIAGALGGAYLGGQYLPTKNATCR